MATVTRQVLRTGIGREQEWLRYTPVATESTSGTTTSAGAADGTTIVDTGLYSSAIDQKIRQRTVICITSGATRGERSFATGPPSTAGAVTVSPAFTAQIGSAITYEAWAPDAPHPDTIDRFIDKSLLEDCWRWIATPITWLRGGDIAEDLAVASDDLTQDGAVVWTGDGNVTVTLQEQVPPEEFVRRVIRIVATATDGAIESNPIECDPTDRKEWRIAVLCRSMATAAGAASGSGNGTEIKLIDKTNSAEITPDVALSTVNRGWTLLESNFTLPATCFQLAVQLNVETNTEVGEFAWIQLWPKGEHRISLPQRIEAKKHVGPVFIRTGTTYGKFRRAAWNGALERRDVGGTGVQLELDSDLNDQALWFYERDSFPILTSATPAATDDDNTTWATELWVRAAATYQLYRALRKRDRKGDQNWDVPESDALALLLAMQDEYGAEPMVVEDAATPAYPAVINVH